MMRGATGTATEPVRVLLIEDNPGEARLIREALADARTIQLSALRFDVHYADRLATGLARLDEGDIDLILLDLSLPDAHGIETFAKTHAREPDTPIIVLTGNADETLAIKALQAGAQDYLVKEMVNSMWLPRAVRYAIERHRMQTELRTLSLTDELTGLYNRRGFLTLAEQQLRLAHRTDKGLWLVFVDMDDLKQINDTYGHQEGSDTLVKVTEILRKTFRDSDIIARFGGDEFTILAIDDSGSDDFGDSVVAIPARLQENLHHFNAQETRRPYKITVSIGVVRVDPNTTLTIAQFLTQADEAMYEHKRTKRKHSF